jgi:D-sedoheptulose 7-phosphate isomerase
MKNNCAEGHVPGKVGDLTARFDAEFADHALVLERSRSALATGFCALVEACTAGLAGGGKLLLFGNGGSAADAQHIATELSVRYQQDRAALAALALTTDTSALTAAGNDLGFDRIFSRQIEALGRPGDVALGISTSGRSPNVVQALRTARELGLVTTALTGGDGGELPALAEPCLIVPSASTARIQEMHILVAHSLCGALETALGRME